MRGNQQRRVPVPSQCRTLFGFLGLDIDGFPRLAVVPHKTTILPLRINGVGIIRIHSRFEPVAKDGHKPVAIADAMLVVGARGTSLGGIVLRPTIDVVKRFVVGYRHFVELGDRQICLVIVRFASIPGLVQTTIATDDQVILVCRIDDDGVVVDMLVLFPQRLERFAAILADHHHRIERIDSVRIVRAADNFVVVLGAARDIAAHLLPGFTSVGTAEKTTFAFSRFDDRINNLRIHR